MCVAIFATGAFMLLVTGPAAANTFCVPVYTATCPNNGTNIEKSNLETAMGTNSSDGNADTIYFGASTYTDPDTLSPLGSDHLTIIGSGTDKSFITSSDNGNQYVVNLGSASRIVDMSDLTIVIPASFPDSGGNGSGLQAEDGTFDHVDIKSLNEESGGAPSLIGDVVWKNSHIYGANGGSIDFGIEASNSPGRLEIINTTIDDSVWGVVVSQGNAPTILKQSRINRPVGYGVFISNGGKFVMENSVIVGGNTPAILASTSNGPSEEDIDASIRASTIVAGANPATSGIQIQIKNAVGSQNANVEVTGSIISGFANSWDLTNASGPGIGNASLSLRSSDFKPVGLPDQSVTVDFVDPSNIDADPKFAGATDFHLLPGSPAIDAASAADTGTTEDYDGTVRPLDGNGDGSRVNDMGAFEAAEVPTCANTPALCPLPPTDTTAPVISKLKFKSAPKNKAGKLTFTLSEAAAVKATFKPVPAKKKGQKKRKRVKLTKAAKAGANLVKVGKKKLKPGKYKLTVVATDGAGNSSKAIKRTVRVKKAK